MKRIIAIFISCFMAAMPLYAMPAQTYPAPGPGRNAYSAVTPITYTGNKCSAYGGSGSVTSISCTLTVASTGDTVLIEVVAAHSGGFTVSSNTVCGNTATILPDRSALVWNSFWYSTVLYLPNAASGSCTVTLGFSTGVTYATGMAMDISGANTSTPIDNASCVSTPYCSASGSSTSPSASITTAYANELVVAFDNGASGSAISGGSGYTFFTNGSNVAGQAAEYALKSSSGTYSPAFSLSPSGTWFVTVVALKH